MALLQNYEQFKYLGRAAHSSKKLENGQSDSMAAFTLKDLRLSQILRCVASTLIPQPIRHLIWNDNSQPIFIAPTTWMDGLRGWAALAVFNFHFFYAFTDGAAIGFAADDKHMSVWELPAIRIVYDGANAVNVFFVVAGYVCSTKALHLMSKGEPDDLLKSLSRSAFRKFFRLYLPVAAISLMTAVAAYAGLFEFMRPLMDERKKYFPGHLSEPQLEQYATLSGQLVFWLKDMWPLTDVFRSGPLYPVHDNHLWSIQYEFRSSMHLYICLIGLARFRSWARIACMVVLSGVYLSWDRWDAPLFFMGAAIAQYDIVRKSRQATAALGGPKPQRLHGSRYRRTARILGYLLALYLMSFPIANLKKPSPGFGIVNRLIPSFYSRKEKFPKSIGVLMLFYLLATSFDDSEDVSSNVCHRFLTSHVARYLGTNMLGLYVVHGPFLHAFGYGMPHFFWNFMSKDSPAGWYSGLALGWLSALLSCVALAEIFTNQVDKRCARFIDWLEGKLSSPGIAVEAG